MNIENLNFS